MLDIRYLKPGDTIEYVGFKPHRGHPESCSFKIETDTEENREAVKRLTLERIKGPDTEDLRQRWSEACKLTIYSPEPGDQLIVTSYPVEGEADWRELSRVMYTLTLVTQDGRHVTMETLEHERQRAGLQFDLISMCIENEG